MKLEDLKTIEQLIDFLSGTHAVAFSVISGKDACYHWIQRELVKFHYLNYPRAAKEKKSWIHPTPKSASNEP